jgi:hypothetical protein
MGSVAFWFLRAGSLLMSTKPTATPPDRLISGPPISGSDLANSRISKAQVFNAQVFNAQVFNAQVSNAQVSNAQVSKRERSHSRSGKAGCPANATGALSAGARRLLTQLGEGRAAMEAIADDAVVLVSPDARGVSLSGSRFPLAAATALVDSDLAAWQDMGKARRLVLTDAGAARLRRAAAPDGHGFLGQHRELEPQEIDDPHGGRTGVLRDGWESPLAWLRRRKDSAGQPLIGAAAFAAGERFRADLTLARTLPRVTADWSGIGGRGGSPSTGPELILDRVLAARQRIDAAAKAVGPELAGLLIDVCGFLKGLEDVERERRWPARSAKVVLGIALDRLATHYGYADEARGHSHAARILAWTS